MPRELTFRQRLFVEAYIGEANGNATEAARIASSRRPNKVAERLVGKRVAVGNALAGVPPLRSECPG
jgi:phage terminase small subunit